MMFDVSAYLARIAIEDPPEVDARTLVRLHRSHLLAVPFENLDIHRGRPIRIDESRIFKKVVHDRRGGFCYELNGVFAGLLRRLGFDVTMLSARAAREAGGFGPEFDHMALRVDLDGVSWLADVGFGDSFRDPLRLEPDVHQTDSDPRGQSYRLTVEEEEWTLWGREHEGEWKPSYLFRLTPRRFEEYAAMCEYHQTSPDSHFTRKRVCSRATPEGRITLTADRLITTTAHGRGETIVSQQEWPVVLRDRFGVVLDGATPGQ